MRTALATGVLLASLNLACISSLSLADGGVDGGVDAGPVVGSFGFPLKSAVVVFSANFVDSGVDPTRLAIILSSLPLDAGCQFAADDWQYLGPSPGTASFLTLRFFGGAPASDTTPLAPGTFNVLTDADAADGGIPGVLLERFDSTPANVQSLYNLDQSGTATLNAINWPVAIADGGIGVTGGSVSGHLSATLLLDGGATTKVSGGFSAKPCY
jgi:hypothetical protein